MHHQCAINAPSMRHQCAIAHNTGQSALPDYLYFFPVFALSLPRPLLKTLQTGASCVSLHADDDV